MFFLELWQASMLGPRQDRPNCGLLWDRLLITQSPFFEEELSLLLAQSQAAVLWVGVSTRKLCAYPDLSRAACCCRIAMIWLK